MAFEESKYWFVPLTEIQNENGAKLRTAGSKVIVGDQLVKEGEAFTVSLESFYVKEKLEDSGNDLLVRSWIKYGGEPTVERIHFFQKDVPEDFLGENLPAEHMFSKQDHSEDNRVSITLEITEIDRGLKANKSISENISEVTNTFGGVFPAILPFIGMASNVVGLLGKLSALMEKNTQVFQSTIDLYAKDSFETPLRYGAYIFFLQEVKAAMYKLLDLKLKPASKQIDSPLHDYVVIKIVPGIIHSGSTTDDELLMNQQLASVLSQLDEGEKKDDGKRQQHLHFLQETIKAAHNMKELDYFYRLKRKKKLGITLNETQQKRFLEIAEKLEDYIPDI